MSRLSHSPAHARTPSLCLRSVFGQNDRVHSPRPPLAPRGITTSKAPGMGGGLVGCICTERWGWSISQSNHTLSSYSLGSECISGQVKARHSEVTTRCSVK